MSGLRIGSLTLDPAFDAGITHYTANTTNATNSVIPTPASDKATTTIWINGQESEDGRATWSDGINTVAVNVYNQTAKTTYTIDVKKT